MLFLQSSLQICKSQRHGPKVFAIVIFSRRFLGLLLTMKRHFTHLKFNLSNIKQGCGISTVIISHTDVSASPGKAPVFGFLEGLMQLLYLLDS